MGGRDWVGRIGLGKLEGGGSFGWVGVEENPTLKAHELPPQCT